MAHKRKAQEAFGLSAFAAARLPFEPPETLAAESYDVSQDDDEQHLQPDTPRPNVQLSNFATNAIVEKGDSVEVTLQAKQSISCVGEYYISVLKGLATIYGSILHPASGSHPVYALSTTALPPVTAVKDGSVILLSSTETAARITRLETCSPLFRGIGAADRGSGRSFTVLKNSADDHLQRLLVPLDIDDDTKKVLSRLSARFEAKQPARVMAVGPKSSGKSTFNRLLCNVVTSRPDGQHCLYLDLDPGQPEFGPSGQISLVEVKAPVLGPSFTHVASVESSGYRLIRSHTLGAVSFKDDPELYIRSVRDLAKYTPQHLPLVVNSCGWVNGVGATVILELANSLLLTDVIILHPIDVGLGGQLEAQFNIHHIGRKQGRNALRSPADLRAMQTLAYFHHRYSRKGNRVTWKINPTQEMRPLGVGYTSAPTGIAAILSYGEMPHPDFLKEVIDGTVLAIVVLDPDHPELASIRRTESDVLPYTCSQANKCSPPVDPRHSQCVGLALIRGIDTENKKLQLVTPLADSQIARWQDKQVVLVRGSFDCPDWAYVEGINTWDEGTSLAGKQERPWVSYSDPVGIEGSVWRLRHPPMAADVRSMQ